MRALNSLLAQRLSAIRRKAIQNNGGNPGQKAFGKMSAKLAAASESINRNRRRRPYG